MIRSLGTRRVVATGVVLLLLAVTACGDDDAADSERYCEIHAELSHLATTLVDQLGNPVGASPDEAREAVGEARNLIDEAAMVAPDEIRPSVDVAAVSFARLLDAFQEADFFVFRVDQTELATVRENEVAASDALEEWADANCSSE